MQTADINDKKFDRLRKNIKKIESQTQIYKRTLITLIQKNKKHEMVLKWLVAISLTPFITRPEILNDEFARYFLGVMPLITIFIHFMKFPEVNSDARESYLKFSGNSSEVKKILSKLEVVNYNAKIKQEQLYKEVMKLETEFIKSRDKLMLIVAV